MAAAEDDVTDCPQPNAWETWEKSQGAAGFHALGSFPFTEQAEGCAPSYH